MLLESVSLSIIDGCEKEFEYKANYEIIINKYTNKITILAEFINDDNIITSKSKFTSTSYKIENGCLIINYEYTNVPQMYNKLCSHNGKAKFEFKKDDNKKIEFIYYNNTKEHFSRGYSKKSTFLN